MLTGNTPSSVKKALIDKERINKSNNKTIPTPIRINESALTSSV